MGKDKKTFTKIDGEHSEWLKEIEERCESDVNDVRLYGGLQQDLYKECWKAGFVYAGERIQKIFELGEKGERK